MADLPKTVYRAPIAGGLEVSTQFAQQFVIAVTARPLVGSVVWSLLNLFIHYIAEQLVHHWENISTAKVLTKLLMASQIFLRLWEHLILSGPLL